MAVIFDTVPVYGILGDGRLVQTSTYREDGTNKYYVGGKIFYIDETASGATYTFYSRTGAVLTDVRVGDAPYAYTVTGTPSKDKYYVFNADITPGRQKRWTYKDTSEAWVYTALGTADGIGTGKTNTSIVMAADNGAYVSASDTVWNALKTLNTNVDKGCNDWFVSSKTELETLRTAIDRDGNALTTLFSNSYVWSSSESSARNAYDWYYSNQYWSNHDKQDKNSLVASRSF